MQGRDEVDAGKIDKPQATIQLIGAATVWIWITQIQPQALTASAMSSVVSLALGALLANIVSVVLMVIETANFRHH